MTEQIYYLITEKEISYFVQHAGNMDQSVRDLAQKIYARSHFVLEGW